MQHTLMQMNSERRKLTATTNYSMLNDYCPNSQIARFIFVNVNILHCTLLLYEITLLDWVFCYFI